jgi:hypothetical protein
MAKEVSIETRAVWIAQRTFYSNPYWSDWVDPQTDEGVLWAAQVEANSIEVRRHRWRLSWLIALIPALLGVLSALLLRRGDLNSPKSSIAIESSPTFVDFLPWIFGLLFVATVVAVWNWTNASRRPAANAERSVAQQSYRRYEEYLGWLSANDTMLYGQILQWHQNQEMIRLQQQSVAQQQKILANQQRMIQEQQQTNTRLWNAEQDRRNRNL